MIGGRCALYSDNAQPEWLSTNCGNVDTLFFGLCSLTCCDRFRSTTMPTVSPTSAPTCLDRFPEDPDECSRSECSADPAAPSAVDILCPRKCNTSCVLLVAPSSASAPSTTATSASHDASVLAEATPVHSTLRPVVMTTLSSPTGCPDTFPADPPACAFHNCSRGSEPLSDVDVLCPGKCRTRCIDLAGSTHGGMVMTLTPTTTPSTTPLTNELICSQPGLVDRMVAGSCAVFSDNAQPEWLSVNCGNVNSRFFGLCSRTCCDEFRRRTGTRSRRRVI